MTSTTSNDFGTFAGFLCGLAALLIIITVGCNADQPSKSDAHPKRVSNAEVMPSPDVVPEPPQPSPKAQEAVPDPPKKESPYYGSTYWDELLTSVYFYPKDSNTDFDGTHLKFNHREDDIWLCGDQRKSFKPGHRIKLTVTFEPNQPCATNWQIE